MTPEQHLTEARRIMGGFERQRSAVASAAVAQGATAHATIAMAMTAAQADQTDTIAKLRAELEEARALSEERRAALHYVIYPDEGRTFHPTTEHLRKLAAPDSHTRPGARYRDRHGDIWKRQPNGNFVVEGGGPEDFPVTHVESYFGPLEQLDD